MIIRSFGPLENIDLPPLSSCRLSNLIYHSVS